MMVESAARPVLSMGEILIDLIVTDGASTLDQAETFLARAGGAPANAAVALARLGIPSAFCGVAGKDPFGARLQHELAAERVDTSRLRLSDAIATTLAFAWKDSRGDGHFWFLRGAHTALGPQDAEGADIAALSALMVGSVALATQPSRDAIETAVALANRSQVPVVFDFNLRPTLWATLADAVPICEAIASRSFVVKLSLDDAVGMYGEDATPQHAIRHLFDLGPRAVVLTDGERGCWFAIDPGREIGFVPAFAVKAVEPTGAGDAFSAALVARLIASNWRELTADDVRYAAAAGALATTRHGAWDGLPNRAELDTFLADHLR